MDDVLVIRLTFDFVPGCRPPGVFRDSGSAAAPIAPRIGVCLKNQVLKMVSEAVEFLFGFRPSYPHFSSEVLSIARN